MTKSMFDLTEIEQIRAEMSYIEHSSIEVLELVKQSGGQRVLLNSDLSLIFDTVWGGNSERNFKKWGNQLTQLLLQKRHAEEDFVFYFTHASFMELLRSFHVALEKTEAATDPDYYERVVSRPISEQVTITNRDAEAQLRAVVMEYGSPAVSGAVDRALTLVGKDGVIKGFSDVVDSAPKYDEPAKNHFEEMLRRMIVSRDQSGNRSLNAEQLHFRCRVDAANVVHTMAMSRDLEVPTRFVTDPHMRSRYISRQGTTPVTPYIWTASQLLSKQDAKTYGDYKDFLQSLASTAVLCQDLIAGCDDIKDLSSSSFEMIKLFHQHKIRPIYLQSHSSDSAEVAATPDVSSRNKFRREMEDSGDMLREGVARIVTEAQSIIEQGDPHGFDEDPIAQRMRKDFGLA